MIKIRQGEERDIEDALSLIKELAVYEKALNEVENTAEKMKVDGFGKNPVFHFIVAEDHQKIVGMSLYYYRYSTWKSKRLYLEDLIVTEKQRGEGIGKKLFEKTIEIAKKTGCSGITWQVLDWNEPAIRFYKKYKTTLDGEWLNCNMDF